jgi:hypothetical protein
MKMLLNAGEVLYGLWAEAFGASISTFGLLQGWGALPADVRERWEEIELKFFGSSHRKVLADTWPGEYLFTLWRRTMFTRGLPAARAQMQWHLIGTSGRALWAKLEQSLIDRYADMA